MRRLEENEFVWAWERNNPDVETQLVFKQLIGLLNFAICYPETSVLVAHPVEIRVKVRDPDSGNQLVNNHRGELALFVCPAGEDTGESGDAEDTMDDEKLQKILAQKAEQDGVFSMTFTPPDPGYYHMMMRFNGFPLQDRAYKLHVVKKKKKVGFIGKKKTVLHKQESSEGVNRGGENKRKSWYMKRG